MPTFLLYSSKYSVTQVWFIFQLYFIALRFYILCSRNVITFFCINYLFYFFSYDGNNSVPVHFGTSWYNIDWSQSSNHSNYLLMQSIDSGGMLNMTFKVDFEKLSKVKSKEITKGKKWEIGSVQFDINIFNSSRWKASTLMDIVQRRIQNPIKHLRCSVSRKELTDFNL